MAELQEGDPAPDFTLPSSSGENVSLRDFRGRNVILYFYPKDDTPGCTTQACGIRDAFARFADTDAVVLGVSPDDVASHRRFIEKYGLPFRLLADTDHQVAEAYGAWKQKSMFGKRYMGIERSTFVIDPEGKLRKILRRVNPKSHVDDVLTALNPA